jgi:hypothetical protein
MSSLVKASCVRIICLQEALEEGGRRRNKGIENGDK